MYEVLQVDEGHEGDGEHDEAELDVDVGGLLGGVQVPVETEAQADPAPHRVGRVVLVYQGYIGPR